MAQIICENVALGYGGNAIVEDLSFSVSEGDYLYIVGENGSGKTTLMKTLLGLASPIRGRIIYGDGLRQNEIGYLPQQTLAQRDFPASVNEIVLSGCQGRMGLRPFYRQEEKDLALENIKRMGIEDLKDRCYRELSGGQQQRVLLARALCATRKVLLLDEPVSGLDSAATEQMYQLIRQLNEEGITIIMISHDLKAAETEASHILHIGENIFFGEREAFFTPENNAASKKTECSSNPGMPENNVISEKTESSSDPGIPENNAASEKTESSSEPEMPADNTEPGYTEYKENPQQPETDAEPEEAEI